MLANFGWVLPRRLAGMARPHPGAAEHLKALGVSAVLTLTEMPPLPEFAAAGLAVRHEPILDFAAPDAETLARCVAFVTEAVESGGAVVVHCHAGYGRTGTVLAAALVAQGLEPDAAIGLVRDLRPGSLETWEQEDAVRRFARSIPEGPPPEGDAS
jgi:atypical dual specificity phosphatase